MTQTQTSAAVSTLPGSAAAGIGDPAPVLLLHEPAGKAAVWAPAFDGVDVRRRIVLADANTGTDALAARLRDLSSLPFHVVGLGAGGTAAASLARTNKGLVRSVVVIDGGSQRVTDRVPRRTLILSGTSHAEDSVALAAALSGELLRLPALGDVMKDSDRGYLGGLLEAFWSEVDGAPTARRALVVYTRSSPDLSAASARWESLVGDASRNGPLSLRVLETTGGYATDPNRPQAFHQTRAAIQLDYAPDDEALALALLGELGLPEDDDAHPTLAVGDVVVCLPPVGRYVLLLGARRKPGLTFEEFRLYWSLAHAPIGTEAFRRSPVPLGYELFLVDHKVTDAQDAARWRPDWVDGWMHITSAGADDFGAVEHQPERRAWVLEDERHFVDFDAPMAGQQMYAQSITTTTH